MFIRNIKYFVLLNFILLAQSKFAIAASSDRLDALDAIPSGSVHFRINSNFAWAEYCPDNTCDVIRSKKAAPARAFKVITYAYYYYFSEYSYLKDWQLDAKVGRVIDDELKASLHDCCDVGVGREFAKCKIRQFGKKYSLQVFFVRFDEGEKISQRFDIDSVLK